MESGACRCHRAEEGLPEQRIDGRGAPEGLGWWHPMSWRERNRVTNAGKGGKSRFHTLSRVVSRQRRLLLIILRSGPDTGSRESISR